jgi:hydrogenase-4 component B
MFPAILPALLLTLPLLGALLSILLKGEKGRTYGYLCASMSAVSGALWALYVLLEGTETYMLPLPSVWGDYAIRLDPLGALVLLITSLTFACVAMYSLFSHEREEAHGSALFNLFMLSVVIALVADQVFLLLVAWETMSLTSFLAAWGAREDEDTTASWKYLAITHFGAILIIAAFVFLSVHSGETRLSAMSGLGASLGTIASTAVVVCLFLGFGSKLGLLPFHIWMPDLYGRAPSSLTALLSTASSNVAVLVLVRATFSYVGVAEQHVLAISVMGLAGLTALWGAWQALMQRDTGRILSFSSMENMGLILLTLGAGMLFQSYGAAEAAGFCILAAMFHLINHTVFKSLLLMGAGAARRSTGQSDLERMGGLAKTLPALSLVFLIGILSVAALPPFNGFVSEWTMFKSLMHAEQIADPLVRLALPLAIAAMALSTAIATAAYLRLYGFMFLGRPRSNGACQPRTLDRKDLFPFIPLTLLCLLLGVASFPLLNELAAAVSPLVGLSGMEVVNGSGISLSHQGGLDPLALGLILVAGITLTYLVLRSLGRRSLVRGDTWDCGTPLDRRTQYTPTGFSQPILRVFEKIYRPRTTVHEEPRPSPYIRSVRFEQVLPDLFVERIYKPLTTGAMFLAFQVKRMQNGSIQTYLAYIMIILVVLLVVLR